MTNNMNKAENEMPFAGNEMPPGNMIDDHENFNNQMPDLNQEMPPGNMNTDTVGFNIQPLKVGEMPNGNMMEVTDSFTNQIASSNNFEATEMPIGKMTDSNSMIGLAQIISGTSEMPLGNMNRNDNAIVTEPNKIKIIEIPGCWKLQMKYVTE